MALSVLAGVVAAALSTLLWYRFTMERGYYAYGASLVAFAIAYAMVAAGRQQRGPRLQIASLALTVVAMMLGNYLVINGLVHKRARELERDVPRLVGPGMYLHAWKQLRYPQDPLFFLVGAAVAGLVPRRKPPPKPPLGG